MSGSNHLGIKGAIASLIAAGALCTGSFAQNPNCPGAGSCTEPNGTPGCDDEVCCNAVCSVDPFCCNNNWDQACANEAVLVCNCQPEDVPENNACESAIPIGLGTIPVSRTCRRRLPEEASSWASLFLRA